MMEELIKAQELVNEFTDKTKGMSFGIFLATVAMLLEEKCKEENRDMVETVKMLYDAAVDVNRELGKY